MIEIKSYLLSLQIVIKEGLFEETLKPRAEGWKGGSLSKIWGKSILRKGYIKYKDPDLEKHLAIWNSI
jgi:hypothetical protein